MAALPPHVREKRLTRLGIAVVETTQPGPAVSLSGLPPATVMRPPVGRSRRSPSVARP